MISHWECYVFSPILGNLSSLKCFLVEDEKYLVFGFAHQASLCLQKEVLVRVGVKKVQEKTCYHEQCVDG